MTRTLQVSHLDIIRPHGSSLPVVLILPFLIIFLLSISQASTASETKIRFGVHPYLSASELYSRFTPLVNLLSGFLSQPVELDVAKDYQTHIQNIGNGRVDLAYLGPMPYIILVEQFGPQPILGQLQIKGKNTFQGAIITRNTDDITDLKEISNKRIAFGDPESTMSHLIPHFMMIEAGLDQATLNRAKFVGSHQNVALGVLTGMFDIGAVKTSVFKRYKAHGLRILRWTPPIPNHLFIATHTLSSDRINMLRAFLLSPPDHKKLNNALKGIKPTITGLVAGSDSDYDSLRKMQQVLIKHGINP
ncbi:MAG: phosphate/phosphite/phosphonate ABC transporter substrate-binding protein [Magnetococcales bacterium]|nr:phosphate/phosphite/phosphonate ABC transporter substrate-binding protein [Magnetococcales bacterium]